MCTETRLAADPKTWIVRKRFEKIVVYLKSPLRRHERTQGRNRAWRRGKALVRDGLPDASATIRSKPRRETHTGLCRVAMQWNPSPFCNGGKCYLGNCRCGVRSQYSRAMRGARCKQAASLEWECQMIRAKWSSTPRPISNPTQRTGSQEARYGHLLCDTPRLSLELGIIGGKPPQ